MNIVGFKLKSGEEILAQQHSDDPINDPNGLHKVLSHIRLIGLQQDPSTGKIGRAFGIYLASGDDQKILMPLDMIGFPLTLDADTETAYAKMFSVVDTTTKIQLT